MSKPSDTFLYLSTFVIKLYVSLWFNTKSNCLAVDGAKNVRKTLVLVNKLPGATQKIKPVTQCHTFFAHSIKYIIMLQNDRNYRELGWCRIKKARSTEREQIRHFTKLKLNFSSDAYIYD